MDNGLQSLSLPYLKMESLFMTQQLPRPPRKLSPINIAGYNTATNGGLISPQSPPRPSARAIDPSLVSTYERSSLDVKP